MTDINSFLLDSRLNEYFLELESWNKKFNLTAITNKEDVYQKHFLDSLLAFDLIKSNTCVLDIGAGAGFPSLVIRLFKELNLTLIDSVNKKVMFLLHLIKKFNLKNTNAIHVRIEDFNKKATFDYTLSRAVAPLNILCEYSIPFLKIGGEMIAYKSDKIEQEINTAKNCISILGGEIKEVKTVMLNLNTSRSIIIIKKIKDSLSIYPRGKNLPRLKPL